MKKFYAFFTLIIICITFSFNALAMNANSPYYPLSIHLSDPDEDALVLRLIRWRYEKEYLKEHGILDANDYSLNNCYISLSYSSLPYPVEGIRCINGFKVSASPVSGNSVFFNHRRVRVHTYDDQTFIKSAYQNVPFFKEQVKKAKEYKTTREQIEYINNFLCDYLSYGYATEAQREEADKISEDIPNGGIRLMVVSRKAICSGYTGMANIFLTLLDIPNCTISESAVHTWNYVYVDGKWKHLDVTWNDSGPRPGKYFLLDEIDHVDSHNWKDYFTDYNQKLLERDMVIEKDNSRIKADVYAEFDEMLSQNDTPISSIDDLRCTVVPKYCGKKWQLAPDDILNLSDPEVPVTRKDFCRIMTQTIEKITDKTIDEILSEKQVSDKQISFLDTDDASVIALAKLGVVAGTGANCFDPDGYVSKVQLAVFVGRIAEKVFDVDVKSQTMNWHSGVHIADENIIINSWYRDEIAWATIHGITDKNIPDAWYTAMQYCPNEYKSYTEALDAASKLYVIFK